MDRVRIFFVKALVVVLPLILILIIYTVTDPFKVLYTYHFTDYYDWQHWELNREMVGVSNLKERLNKNDIPDSYIFGNSRSFVYHCATWESYLKDSTKPFHFDAASESLFGVYTKVKYLDRKNIPIKNALLVCDVSLLAKVTNVYDVTHIKYPDLSGESRYAYQSNFIKGYFTDFFFLKQIDYLVFHKERKYMSDIFAIKKGYIHSDPYLNDYIYQQYETMLKKDSTGYYVFKQESFPDRADTFTVSEPVIAERQTAMLREIKAIFDKRHTRFKLVISPLYDQRKISDADVITLKKIFGENAVYDYSGRNSITADKSNYYESSHYKPYIANKILSEIYSK